MEPFLSIFCFTDDNKAKETIDSNLKLAKSEMKVSSLEQECKKKDNRITNLMEENTLLRETLNVKDQVVVQLTNQVLV